MKVLFLDIDGVLNSQAWMRAWYAEHGVCCGSGGDHEMLDPVAVTRFNRICAVPDVKVVLSSAWRILNSTNHMTRLLWQRGLDRKYRIHDKTPSGGGHRGTQIDQWLKMVGPLVTSFVILDDSSDMEPHMDRLVRTDCMVGLQDADVEAVIRMLNTD